VAAEEPASCPKCGGVLQQESDVLDTWFSSALWPFSTLGWPEQTRELKFFYPTSTLITSFDILFFWVARMMMMGLHFMGEVPFRHVYLHALVRDKFGKKMSKSKGNVLDPLKLMDQYGTDALRFTLIAFAAQGRDIRLAEERIEGYRHFINKIWNAARFALMHINDCDPALTRSLDTAGLALPHRWILHRLNQCTGEVGRALDDYRFNDAAAAIYHFVWHEFCDWYLEWIKADLYGEDATAKGKARTVLFAVLEVILKLLHPITPFVTEEIWHVLPGERGSIMVEPFPEVVSAWDNAEAAGQAEVFMAVVGGIRNIRSEMMVHPSAAVEVLVICHNPGKLSGLAPLLDSLQILTRASRVTLTDQGTRPRGAAANILSDIEIYVPLAGLVDVAKELAKLQKEQARVAAELARAQGKLANEKFMANAPEEVVAKERDKIGEQQGKLEKIRAGMTRLAELAD
jgi:valyl-tRNA synthetase